MLRIEYLPGKFFELDSLGWVRSDDGKEQHLTPYEYGLLKLLLRESKRMIEQQTLAREVWHEEYGHWSKSDWAKWRSAKVGYTLSKLRDKLKVAVPGSDNLIVTCKGRGWYSQYVSFDNGDEKEHEGQNADVKKATLSREYQKIEPSSGDYYCERTHLVEQIEDVFKKKRIVFISGISGSGKTELAYYYGSKGGYDNVIPVALQNDGKGDFQYLCSQIALDDGESVSDVTKILWELDRNTLIIIDNYNDAENPILFDVMRKIPNASILFTSQLYMSDMDEHGAVILIDEVETESDFDKEKFAVQLFCTYAKEDENKLSDADRGNLNAIVKAVQYHTMIVCILGRQIKKSHRSLRQLRELLEKNIDVALRTNIKVSILKDRERITQTPYELMKLLFRNQLIERNFSEREKQVLGALIFAERYSNDMKLICEAVGDYEEYNLCEARDAVYSLQEKGIVNVQGSRLYIHPLLRAMVCDEHLDTRKESTIANLDYNFLLHLIKNKLVEKTASIGDITDSASFSREMMTWSNWVIDFIEERVIPHECSRDEEFDYLLKNDSYLRGMCRGDFGSSFYVRYDSGKEYCLVNGSGQRKKELRYYDANRVEEEFTYNECNLMLSRYENVDTIVIPERIANTPVRTIGCRLFSYNKMKHIVLPETIEWIGEYAFCDCTELQEIIIPDKVERIGANAFTNCASAIELKLGASVKTICAAAFSRCKSIKGKLYLPKSLISIYRYAFCQCTSIEEVDFPDTLKLIGTVSFNSCIRLRKVTFGASITYIARDAFSDCYRLEKVTIPSNVIEIDECAFSHCTRLKEVIVEEGVERIKNHAFGDCEELETVYLPKSISRVIDAPFGGCPNVTVYLYKKSPADLMLKYANERGKRVRLVYREE